MNLYCYVIASDSGIAPNYDPPFTTLAICKPRIRRGASVGDVVLAFTGCKVSKEPHAVRWAGVIAEKRTFAQYWNDRRFAGKKPAASDRSDNIYAPRADGRGFKRIENLAHGPNSKQRDLSGVYVLVIDPCWRFVGSGPILPAEFGYRMPSTARRNHQRHPLPADSWKRLKAWLTARQREVGRVPTVDGTDRCASSSISLPKKARARQGGTSC